MPHQLYPLTVASTHYLLGARLSLGMPVRVLCGVRDHCSHHHHYQHKRFTPLVTHDATLVILLALTAAPTMTSTAASPISSKKLWPSLHLLPAPPCPPQL